MKNWRKPLSLILCLVMCLSLMPVSALAEEGEVPFAEPEQESIVQEPEMEKIVTEPERSEAELSEPEVAEEPIQTVEELTVSVENEEEPAPAEEEVIAPADPELPEDVESEVLTKSEALPEVEPFMEAADSVAVLEDSESAEVQEENDAEFELSADDVINSGSCGENLTWELDSEGTLTISGTGPMDNYNHSAAPWGQVSRVIIVPGVTSIGEFAFYDCGITGIIIPESVNSIGTYAFRNCPLKTAGPIGSGCDIEFGWTSTIPEKAFSYSELASITIPEGITDIEDYAFDGCFNLKDVILPKTLKSIGDNAFSICPITTLTIPNGVISIGYHAFYSCRYLTSISIPESVTSIGNNAFGWCDSLTSISILGNVEIMGDGVFLGCSKLTDVGPIGSGCSIELGWKNTVPDCAFQNCSYITTVSLPEGITKIGDHSFSECSSLTSITIPETVTSIGYGAFYKCISLTEIAIPNSVVSIGMYAFEFCSGLTSVSISENVTCIEEGQFMRCSSLTSIVIPEGVTYFGNAAFDECSSLISVTIPENVRKIGEIAFSDCNSMDKITFVGDAPYYIGADSFQNVTATVSYPKIRSWTEEKRKDYGGTLTWIPSLQLEINAANFPDENFRNIVSEQMDQDHDGVLSKNEINWITGINCEQKGIRSLKGIEHFTKLENLNCRGNELTELDVSSNLELKGLNCGSASDDYTVLGNQLKSLDISKNTKLLYLGCQQNQLTQLDVSHNPELLSINCANNRINALDPSVCKGLQTLHCGYNALTRLNISQCTDLTTLTCGTNNIDSLDVSKCANLENLACFNNQIGSLDLSKNTKLRLFNCSNNNIASLDLRQCGQLSNIVRNGKRTENGNAVTYRLENSNDFVSFDIKVSVLPVVFSDNGDPGAYFHDAVYWAADNGITSGTSPTTFSPGNNCTRGQIVTFLWKAMGSPEPVSTSNPFTDVKPSDYFYKPVLWAKENGITSGKTATTFVPGAPCTRGQIVTFLWIAKGRPEPTDMNNPFTDVKPSDYFFKPVLWAKENGITSGTSATTFSPGKTCTRAQAMTFLWIASGRP